MRAPPAIPTVAAALFASVAAGLLLGPADLDPGEVWRALSGAGDADPERAIVLSLRLPRVVAAALTGAALAVSGAILQALVRNPLAEPFLLGVSAGASLGAVGAIALGVAAFGAATLPLAALAGALLAIAIVFRMARVATRLDSYVLLLAGVVTSAFFGAAVMLILTLAPARAVRSAIFWSMGNLGQVGWGANAWLAAYVLPAVVLAWLSSRHLNALAFGEDAAAHLGTEVEPVKRAEYLLASLLAAATVSVAGVIGFVGLVVPHAIRMLWGSDHRRLLPLSVGAGAALLVAADTLARTVVAPVEIPVGVITAFIGAPFFLVLLRRRREP